MTPKEFDKVVENRIDQIKKVLAAKAQEYSSDNDRFHNFKVAARIKNCTPEQALHGMMLKHEVSIIDLILNPESPNLREDIVNEKIGDMIDYLILLEGLFLERIFENNKKV